MHLYLQNILDAKRAAVERLESAPQARINTRKSRSLLGIMAVKQQPVIIAEIKKASPSKGIIRADFNFDAIFADYENNKNVDALSILTEEKYFLGDIADLRRAAGIGVKPILRKDFIFSEKQVYETAAARADIMLLIAAILTEKEYGILYELAKSVGLEVISEVHTVSELKMISRYNPEIIGVNNRNLDTFEVSVSVSEELIKMRSTNAYFISESGISSAAAVRKLYKLGYKGFLIGEAIMRSADINQALNLLQL